MKTSKKSYLIDMDGVLVSGNTLIPGADLFIDRLRSAGSKFLLLTNNSRYTPRDLAHNLQTIGLDIPDTQIFTSAMATARFLNAQRPHGTAYVIGDSGLTSAIHDIGYIITEHNPAYVVLGETPYFCANRRHFYSLVQIQAISKCTQPPESNLSKQIARSFANCFLLSNSTRTRTPLSNTKRPGKDRRSRTIRLRP
jgi:ribonucleotide monophosphatase NagD (HAD superfamily)